MTTSSVRRLIVLCGGPSGEHEVSLRSGASVTEAARERLDVVRVVWTRDGAAQVDGETYPDLPAAFAHLGVDDRDVVFPALHGPMGEDGVVQGFLEVARVPYVGSGVLASATGMDKVAAKHAFTRAGLSVLGWSTVGRARWRTRPDVVLRDLEGRPLPAFVKPANMGSSVGITRVVDPSDWRTALEEAFRHDTVAVIERGLSGHREIEVAVWGGDDLHVSEPGEIVVGSDGFYDYDRKYTEGAVRVDIPAPLSSVERDVAMRWAREAHVATGAFGLSRVDLFLDATGRFWLNEINTMPGFTRTSMFPKLVEVSGTSMSELIVQLVDLARTRSRSATR